MLIVRIILGTLMVLTAVEVFRMMRSLRNSELIILSYRIGLAVLGFGILRLFAGLIDHYLALETPYFSIASMIGFWIATYAFFWYHRRILQSEEVGEEGRQRISQNVDNIAREMRRYQIRINEVLSETQTDGQYEK